MNRYGNVEDEDAGYPLAAWIWGHRLRLGQHWMEYFLEFLNVLAGFDYVIGQGISNDSRANPERLTYRRFTRLGLRRFIFYDEYETTRDPHDDEAIRLLRENLQRNAPIQTDGSDRESFDLTKALLQAFSAVEEQRSWYAKSLFPAHHNLLFWEALRKGATKYARRDDVSGLLPEQLDDGVVYDARNFFARGGELYYLMISAGTQACPERGKRIAEQLWRLLNERNQALGMLAETIDTVWQSQKDAPQDDKEKGRLGWIVDPNCELYRVIAEDVDTLLQADLDPLETLDLLAHLIGFHLTLYIYHRAFPIHTVSHNDGDCLDTCRVGLLVDAIEGIDGSIIRSVSTTMLREQETWISQTAQQFVRVFVQEWAQESDTEQLIYEAERKFGISRLRKYREKFDKEVNELRTRLDEQTMTRDQFLEGYVSALLEILMVDFKKNFLGVHRKLAKSIGFVAPRKGVAARYVLGSNLLKALTLANLPVDKELTYDEFIGRLYTRYGLIIGAPEAKLSGLFERHRINIEYFDRNRFALLEKMKRAGLAIEYSDATAMVSNRSQA